MAEIIKGMSIEEYHAPNSGWISHSKLHEFTERGPAWFRGRFITGEIAREETESLVLGQALEDMFRFGEGYVREHYAIRPAHLEGKGNTKPAIEWKAAQGNKRILKSAQFESLRAEVTALRNCDKGMEYIRDCEEQLTLRGTVCGILMQARPDYAHLSDFGAHSVDLKRARDIKEFLYGGGRAVLTYGYHTQAALVRKLLAANGYTNASTYLFVAEHGGYRRECFRVPDDYLAWADQLLEKECAALKRCLDEDVWPLGSDDVIELQKPGWARVEQQEAAP